MLVIGNGLKGPASQSPFRSLPLPRQRTALTEPRSAVILRLAHGALIITATSARFYPGHMGGDSIVTIHDAHLIFCGDLLWKDHMPNLMDAWTEKWIWTLANEVFMALITANVFAAMLFGGLLLNRISDPARRRLQELDLGEYEVPETRTIDAQAHG
jgi:glyoxylase-like metal-dependent hydrolase (beta-lactamase superfamily II)